MPFQPITEDVQYPSGFTADDQSLLLDVARLSALAYQEGTNLTNLWNSALSDSSRPYHDLLNRIRTLKIIEQREEGLQAFSCEYKPHGYPDNVLAIVVRGTSDIIDALTDIKIRKIDFGSNSNGELQEGVRVHRGFHDQYESLVTQFGNVITDYLKKGGVVLFSGHSMGAAIATLLAMNYGSFKGTGKVWLTVFGSPAVGNVKFAERCEQVVDLLWRVKNGRDPVCMVPSEFFGYRHAGKEIHLGDEDPLPHFAFLWDIADHAFNKYVENLAQNGTMPSFTPAHVMEKIQSSMAGLSMAAQQAAQKAAELVKQKKVAS